METIRKFFKALFVPTPGQSVPVYLCVYCVASAIIFGIKQGFYSFPSIMYLSGSLICFSNFLHCLTTNYYKSTIDQLLQANECLMNVNQKWNDHSEKLEKELREIADTISKSTQEKTETVKEWESKKYWFHDPYMEGEDEHEALPTVLQSLVNNLEGRRTTLPLVMSLIESAVLEDKVTQYTDYDWCFRIEDWSIVLYIGNNDGYMCWRIIKFTPEDKWSNLNSEA